MVVFTPTPLKRAPGLRTWLIGNLDQNCWWICWTSAGWTADATGKNQAAATPAFSRMADSTAGARSIGRLLM
jgi:hypothetical protein